MHMSQRANLQLLLTIVFAMLADPLIACHSAAHAAAVQEPSSVRTVSLKDLDLSTHAGAVTAYWRIRNAARSVCGTVDTALAEEKAAWNKCVDDAISAAVSKLGAAQLTDYYRTKTHRSQLTAAAEISGPRW